MPNAAEPTAAEDRGVSARGARTSEATITRSGCATYDSSARTVAGAQANSVPESPKNARA
jgi:hypothetical protein